MEKVHSNGLKIAMGCRERLEDILEKVQGLDLPRIMTDHVNDMDVVARELVG